MNEKKVKSLKIVFEDGSDYSVACEVGLDKDEVTKYIKRAFMPEPAERNDGAEKYSEMYKEGYLQGYWDAKDQLTKTVKDLMVQAGYKLYEDVRKELCGEEKNDSTNNLK